MMMMMMMMMTMMTTTLQLSQPCRSGFELLDASCYGLIRLCVIPKVGHTRRMLNVRYTPVTVS